MSDNFKSHRQRALEDKQKVKNIGSVAGTYAVKIDIPRTVLFCKTKERQNKVFNELKKQGKNPVKMIVKKATQ
jgi:hypothetical protein